MHVRLSHTSTLTKSTLQLVGWGLQLHQELCRPLLQDDFRVGDVLQPGILSFRYRPSHEVAAGILDGTDFCILYKLSKQKPCGCRGLSM